MSKYATCPGEACVAKVEVTEAPDGSGLVSFCCIPCFQYTWALLVDVDMEHRMPREHSGQCWMRQELRHGEPVADGDYKIRTPDYTPPSRLGGQGGTQV